MRPRWERSTCGSDRIRGVIPIHTGIRCRRTYRYNNGIPRPRIGSARSHRTRRCVRGRCTLEDPIRRHPRSPRPATPERRRARPWRPRRWMRRFRRAALHSTPSQARVPHVLSPVVSVARRSWAVQAKGAASSERAIEARAAHVWRLTSERRAAHAHAVLPHAATAPTREIVARTVQA